MSETIEKFTIRVPEEDICDLMTRIDQTRWPDQLPDTGWEYGVNPDWVRELANYWAKEFDWKAAENWLNSFNHITTKIDGQKIHAIYERSPEPNALPLVLSHGWPGSIVEFLDVIGPLTNPIAHGGDPSDAFHVIIPSLPGYGWSGPTSDRGWGPTRMARTFIQLTERLGHKRYGVQGGDWGSIISQEMARLNSKNIVGCHVNMITTQAPGESDDMDNLTDFEQRTFDRALWYQAEDNGYFRIQQTRPQTISTGLNDSPAGLLAWIGEKFYGWTDHDGDPFTAINRDTLLTNVSVYWFTNTINSAARVYFEFMRTLEQGFGTTGNVPLGVSIFPHELFASRKSWVEKAHNLVFWSEHNRGGHFAALENPEILVEDIRTFFRNVR